MRNRSGFATPTLTPGVPAVKDWETAKTRAGTSERPAREVRRLGPQSIVEIVWLFRY